MAAAAPFTEEVLRHDVGLATKYFRLCGHDAIPPPGTSVQLPAPAGSAFPDVALFHAVDAATDAHTLYVLEDKCAHGKGRLGAGDMEDLGSEERPGGCHPDGSRAAGLCVRCPKHRRKFGDGLYFALADGASFVPVLTGKYKPRYAVRAFHVRTRADSVWIAAKSSAARRAAANAAAPPARWLAWQVTAVEAHTADSLLFSFALPDATVAGLDDDVGAGVGASWHVAARGNGVERDYTPVSTLDELNAGRMRIVIKVYDGGALTAGFFANLAVGDSVDFSLPVTTVDVPALTRTPAKYRLLLVVGGTGIAPAYQLLYTSAADFADVALIVSQRTPADALLADELVAAAEAAGSSVVAHFSRDAGTRINSAMLADAIGDTPPKRVCAVVCGPPSFEQLADVLVRDCGVRRKRIVVLDA